MLGYKGYLYTVEKTKDDKIRTEQSKFEFDVTQIRQGHEPKPKKVVYRKLGEKVTRLVSDYNNVDLGEYLAGLAANESL
ncbi:unnamed protein product [Adineta ricciae]|uniref:Uncharacterized protein n=1 Tax=Adineta ricciae TaxID=249248 RepID=A0A815PDC7_ADIRI|nr:unnamed protein product [Adineta ricciae]CAF1447802.1 unnamed protein product [Adineta ricciae]